MSTPETLPTWDMSVVFPSLASEEFKAAFTNLQTLLSDLEHRFDRLNVAKAGTPSPEAFDETLQALNIIGEELEKVGTFIAAYVTTDSRDAEAQAKDSEFDQLIVKVRKLTNRLTAWLGNANVDELLAASSIARAHEFAIRKAIVGAKHQMSPEEEALAADLEVSGASAWSKLYGNITSQLVVPATLNGEATTLPMSAIRALAYDEDRETRRQAYEAEVLAWRGVEVPLAAALNSIKGTTALLSKRRGWCKPLDAAVFGANIDPATLEAMLFAARESFPDFRRYMRAKARALGVQELTWYDIFAPVGKSERAWAFDEATSFVEEQFRSYSDKLGDFAARATRERWIDAGPRPGKVDGAYCMGIRKDESRVLMNYKPSFGSVSTLGHELGHAYHNLCLNGKTATQREIPMTLAETASIFCETIIRKASMATSSKGEQLGILEASLQGSCQVVVDITSRFLFEQSVFEQRAERELSPAEMCEAMRQAQLQTYGDGITEESLHTYMWAAKGHYYGSSYYNFPYMFGLLFGLGLYAIYEKEGDAFKPRYDALLAETGMSDAATLAARFGIDLRTPDFWQASLQQIRVDIDEFEKLV